MTPERVRAHLRKLSRAGVGYKSVADAAGVSRSTMSGVMCGTAAHIRREIETKVLAVTTSAHADHGKVKAEATWKILNELIGRGWPRSALAAKLGFKAPALQIRRDRVLARTALAVARLGRALAGQDPPPKALARARGWDPPGPDGLERHRTCRGRGCTHCGGEGWRRR